jgi:hypothetical protein
MFFDDFRRFTEANSYVLWSAQKMQQDMMRHNIGDAYWMKKLEQYRFMRREIGVELI